MRGLDSRARVVFRCDGSTTIGFGHMSRCMTLAAGFRAEGISDIRFVCRESDIDVTSLVQKAGYESILIKADADELEDLKVIEAASAKTLSLLVTDSHNLSREYYRVLHEMGLHVISIDDYAGVAYASDIVVNHNITAEQFTYRTSPHTRLLLGPDYMPLRQTFCSLLGRTREIRNVVESVVVTLGGMPEVNALCRVLQGLRQYASEASIRTTVVLGIQADAASIRRVKEYLPASGLVLVNPPDFANILWEADIVLVNGSMTAYEAAAIGTPLIMTAVDENQYAAVAGFKERRLAITLPAVRYLSAEVVASAMATLVADWKGRREMAASGKRLVDGKGTGRILKAANALFSGEGLDMEAAVHG